jgi:thiol-disulfide isomerase/thioredoxin
LIDRRRPPLLLRLVAAPLIALASVSACRPPPLATDPHPLLAAIPAPQREQPLDGALMPIPTPGHVTVVDFWATWCKPCLRMLPGLEALHRETRVRGVVVVGVASDDNPGLVQAFLREHGVTYANVVAPDGNLRGSYKVGDLPHTFVLDRHGRVRVVRKGGGEADLSALRDAVDTLLGEP